MKRCFFCETSRIETTRYKIVGSDLGKRKQKTVNICLTCDAMMDNEQIRDFLDWSKLDKIIYVGK